jgi:hypothetical protein
VTPNEPKDISSWAYEYAASKVEILDNRAKAVACYDPGYTLVEKLQTISSKYRRQQERGETPVTQHYYDVYCLLREPSVQTFVGTADVLLTNADLKAIGARVIPETLRKQRVGGGHDRDRTCDPYNAAR